MPTYNFECNSCKNPEEKFCKMDERHSQMCSKCGNKTTLVFGTIPPAVISDEIDLRFSVALGKPIEGRADWKRQMKAKGFSKELDPY